MRNIIGLGKGTPKSRYGSFRNTMMIRLLKVIKKYRMHFNEHPTLYNDIINEFKDSNYLSDGLEILLLLLTFERL